MMVLTEQTCIDDAGQGVDSRNPDGNYPCRGRGGSGPCSKVRVVARTDETKNLGEAK